MRINEQAFRRILREEARRTRLFEAGMVEPAAPTMSAGTAAAPAPVDPTAEVGRAAAEAPAPAASDPLGTLKTKLRNIMFGDDGNGGESSSAGNKTAMLWTDMVLDVFAGVGESESDDGDLARLPVEVKEEILDQTVDKATKKQLDKDSFYEIVSSNYANTFPDLDPPQQDDGITRPGTNTYWPYVQAAVMQYQKAVAAAKANPAAAIVAAAAGAPAAGGAVTPGAPAAGAGTKYKVVFNDTLSQIALRFYGNGAPAAYQALGAAVGVAAPYGLKVGQTLSLPASLTIANVPTAIRQQSPTAVGAMGALSEGRSRINIAWGR